ncbi:Serine/threonine-protein kinase PknB [Rubripirellula obstinata]|uniref:Serine/threonine-protein kinase PknB n=1 Tax=Rubripirellula obstinata TaxID=406547 RepID=A0A5B1CBV1_9BACT|nr:serine/threonine protein kinase [Rubripirellula obstinata]KAA1257711.1 Serine/threonine-protein kinase PknB [Rubripirellula obstinata]
MDAARYNRIRELFLAVEELPPGQQEAFLQVQTAGDVELLEEVVSLLAEHDPQAAQVEGECAQPVNVPDARPDASASASDTNSSSSFNKNVTSTGSAIDSSLATPKVGGSSRQKSSTRNGLITQQGALRTHASPRYNDTPRPNKASSTTMPIWAERTRQSRRRTSRWFWLAALLPTALIGWWTYRGVDAAMQSSIEATLASAVDHLQVTTDRFLTDEAKLVESWARQPLLNQSVNELVELSRTDPPIETMRTAKQIDRIHEQLRRLSGSEDVKFVVWNQSFRILASWQSDRADVGSPVHPSGAANLARVMAGETVIFGPERLTNHSNGFVPETKGPVMAVIVPIEGDDGRIVAAMLVRGLQTFEQFDSIFRRICIGSSLDAYAINRDGLMVTKSPVAVAMATQFRFDYASDEIAANLRVSDPGFKIASYKFDHQDAEDSEAANSIDVRRSVCPVTVAVAGATSEMQDVRTVPYVNYAGEQVVGAWRWLSPWQIGIIVEQDAAVAFGPSRLVRFSFLLLGSLLSVTAFLAAAKLARTSTAEHAAIHPLSRYEVLSELGSGGMGVVYRGRHLQLGRDVALKLLRGDRHSEDDRKRFDREAKLAASLKNPHSVMIYDYGHSPQGEAFCVMQLLQGLTLQEVVARGGYQPVGRVLTILRQICDALAEAHGMNLLHRDIKPQNVMLSLDPSVGDWVVVFDYGLAKPLEPDANVYQTSETIWSGTPMYMAPERFREPTKLDPRSDLYSIGCIAYYLLAGRPPFIESQPESLFSLILSEQPIGIAIHRGEEIAAEVSAMVMKCMAKKVEDRYKTVAELAREIDRLRLDHDWSVDQAKVWWSHHGGE